MVVKKMILLMKMTMMMKKILNFLKKRAATNTRAAHIGYPRTPAQKPS